MNCSATKELIIGSGQHLHTYVCYLGQGHKGHHIAPSARQGGERYTWANENANHEHSFNAGSRESAYGIFFACSCGKESYVSLGD